MKVSELKIGRPSESGHFYSRTGDPRYEVRGKNGVLRPATLRDARANNWVPGVSTILGMAAKPALVNWQIEQALLASLTLPRLPNETDDSFIGRAREDSKEQARKAAERGTQLHAVIQSYFEGATPASIGERDWAFVAPVRDWLAQRYGLSGWTAEESFASPLGYGGKCDLLNRKLLVVADFKVKEFGESKQGKDLAYLEHVQQLAAYAYGLGFPLDKVDAINIFISRDKPGLIRVREWDQKEIVNGWRAFAALLDYYKVVKDFDPSFEVAA